MATKRGANALQHNTKAVLPALFQKTAALLCAVFFWFSPLSAQARELPIGTTEGYESGEHWFGADFAYDITDDAACWALLQKPITVLNLAENEKYYLLDAPKGKRVLNQRQGGFISGALAAVHVLGEDEDGYTLVEGLDFYDRLIKGYVKTKLLKTVTPNEKYGLIIDKLTQRLYVFIDGKQWSSCAVSTGLVRENEPFNETASGEYLMGSWVGGFDSEGIYCEMGMRFNGGDLLHQVPYITLGDGTVRYSTYEALLGQKASHGCVRVARKPNEDGLNIRWLWENLKKGSKVLIWDDDGRALPYPSDDLLLYYNPKGGSFYHSVENCESVKKAYLPLTALRYSELDADEYAKLKPCGICTPVQRKSVIDEGNRSRGVEVP
ncbi:MAG: L,D-transpeptidase, partial [Clostridia bacterium]